VYLEDGEMAIIRLHKSMKVRNIKDDSLVDPYIQELQMNLEHRKKVTPLYVERNIRTAKRYQGHHR
jgi:hypothetical protein